MQTAKYAEPGKQQGDINSRDTEAIRSLRGCLAPNYSMCSPQTTSIGIGWELLGNAESAFSKDLWVVHMLIED